MMNGYKQYVRSRETPSAESIKRSKCVNLTSIEPHPVFGIFFYFVSHPKIVILGE